MTAHPADYGFIRRPLGDRARTDAVLDAYTRERAARITAETALNLAAELVEQVTDERNRALAQLTILRRQEQP